MTEKELIQHTQKLNTQQSLQKELSSLGLKAGQTVLVHTSLRSMGWIAGAEMALILALEEVLTSQGTLVMPTHSTDLSEPCYWENPAVSESWWQTIRDETPAFEPSLTRTRGMGRTPETFRKQTGVQRSPHPLYSFAAWGEKSSEITKEHLPCNGFNQKSPLGFLVESDGWILLIGVDFESNTSLHLAEEIASYEGKRFQQKGAPLTIEGQRKWITWEGVEHDSSDFLVLQRDFEKVSRTLKRGKIGQADCLWMSQKELIDFAIPWFESNRSS